MNVTGATETINAQNSETLEEKAEQEQARREAQERARQEAIAAAPFVSVSIQSSGIHPSTSRMITVDVVTLSPTFEPVETFHAVLNSNSDPGPFHLHGVTPAEFASAKKFGQILKSLDRLIDGRTLLIHNVTRGWGFIVSEAKRAMNDAARANRSNARGNRRGGRGRRRQRVGHIPRPLVLVDTLASARRQGIVLDDVRIRGVAHTLGLNASPAQASVERAQTPHQELCREETLLVGEIYAALAAAGPIAEIDPAALRPDKFGLQRTAIRVQAQEATPNLVNPGVYEPGKSLIEGMEVVVAPEIEMDPDIIIQACVDSNLAYSEKLTRQTSVVVCNQTRDIDGKAMHAQRKGIPLLSDVAFMAAVERIKEGQKLPAESS
ncbi:DNA polymerase III subunit epsilon [Corynebacterium callunae]|uniref:DNA polymerase III subunit epsilon n=1 Tax=Corynebacterium callunae TaxID=1721 RepID=UPI0020004FC3|nr:DNA polymerase III subunit epsilon [Corynebacterium callunae]MCK2199636.1 DNA polymerase III subunit epsilon [Corynebacterium callunae]